MWPIPDEGERDFVKRCHACMHIMFTIPLTTVHLFTIGTYMPVLRQNSSSARSLYTSYKFKKDETEVSRSENTT